MIVVSFIGQAINGAGSYPEWMPLVFGRYLRFDRYDDQSDQPSLGIERVRY